MKEEEGDDSGPKWFPIWVREEGNESQINQLSEFQRGRDD